MAREVIAHLEPRLNPKALFKAVRIPDEPHDARLNHVAVAHEHFVEQFLGLNFFSGKEPGQKLRVRRHDALQGRNLRLSAGFERVDPVHDAQIHAVPERMKGPVREFDRNVVFGVLEREFRDEGREHRGARS